MTRPSLETLIASGRRLDVRPDHAEHYVAELARWAQPTPRPQRRWLSWLTAGFAAAAAAAVALFLVGRRETRVHEPVHLGDRVAIIADASAIYRVVAMDADRTEILIDRGTVTARLFHGAGPYVLALRGRGVEAVATGTVYSLTVDERGSVVSVHDGTVQVHADGAEHAVSAGTTWPANETRAGADAARELLAISAPSSSYPTATPSPAPHVASADDTSVVIADASIPTASSPAQRPPDTDVTADAAPDLREQWRVARLLRGQGKFDAAVAACLAIADANDRTWSPIALVEAARIQLGPLSTPEQAVALVDRFEREWAGHELAPEARELRCRALRQLGRGNECAADAHAPR